MYRGQGGEARWRPKMSMGGREKRGPARSGATSAWLGEFRVRNCAPGCIRGVVRERFGDLSELGNRLSGSFRCSEIGSQSLLSVHFVGMFDFKAGRWQCGAHAMAENTKSHETCSTLSGNAVNVDIFFQGRRMWPLARKSTESWILEASDERCSDRLAFFVSEFWSLWSRGPSFM